MVPFDLAAATIEFFEPRLNETFRLQDPSRELALALAEVQRLGTSGRDGGAFSLLFLTEPGPFLPQAIYPLTHPVLGTMELFLVPLGPQQGRNAYQAIFA